MKLNMMVVMTIWLPRRRRAEDIQNAAHQESNPIRGRGRGLQVLPSLLRQFLALQQGQGSADAGKRAADVVDDAVDQDLLLLHLLEVKLVGQTHLAGLLQHFLALAKMQPQPLQEQNVAPPGAQGRGFHPMLAALTIGLDPGARVQPCRCSLLPKPFGVNQEIAQEQQPVLE